EGVLWRANRNGSNPVQLTDAPMEVLLPRCHLTANRSPLRSIPREHMRDSTSSLADGGSPRKILFENQQKTDDKLTWSPDGHRMVGDSNDGKLRILNLDTHGETTIPGSDGLDGPRWSPDGGY